MSIPAFGWALEQGAKLKLRPSDRLLLLFLADQANGELVCWTGQPAIEHFTGLATNTVRAAVQRLSNMQLIRVESVPGKVTKYHILRHYTPSNGDGVASRHTPSNGDGAPPQNVRGGDPGPPQTVPPTPSKRAPQVLSFSQEERKSTFLPECDATTAVASVSPRDELWRDGVGLVQSLLGVMDRGAQSFLGKLLKVAGDDCTRVLVLLREAHRQRPIDPASWLMANARPFRNAGLAIIADEGIAMEGAAAMQRMLIAAEAKGHG